MDNTNRHGPSADISTKSTPFNQAYWVVPDQLMAGCYLARHGHAADQRLMPQIQMLRKSTVTHHLMSPETNQQIELIRSWVETE